MTFKRRTLFIAYVSIAFALGLPMSEAHGDSKSESSFWFMSLSRFRFSEDTQGFLDIQPRTSIDAARPEADGDLRQMLTRGAVGYDLADNVTLFQGYATIAEYEATRVEHRPFQELLASTNFNNLSMLHRFRFEQRLLEGVSGVSLRGRYFLRVLVPLTDSISLTSNEEAFFHLNDRTGGPQAGFDQNRLFLGINLRLAKDVSVDVGYQNQFIERRRGASDALNHIIFLGLFTSCDLS